MLIRFEKKNLVCIIGDYNLRINDKTEILENSTDIKERINIDNVMNDFLINNTLCVLTGRFGTDSNKFTSASTRDR